MENLNAGLLYRILYDCQGLKLTISESEHGTVQFPTSGMHEGQNHSLGSCINLISLEVVGHLDDYHHVAALRNLVNLRLQGLNDEQLSQVALNRLYNLESLHLDDGQLTKISIHLLEFRVSKLRRFSASNNQLTNCDLSRCSELEEADLSNNRLQFICSVGRCQKLKILRVTGNPCPFLPVLPKSLRVLEASNLAMDSLACFQLCESELSSVRLFDSSLNQDPVGGNCPLTALKMPKLQFILLSDSPKMPVSIGDLEAFIADKPSYGFVSIFVGRDETLESLEARLPDEIGVLVSSDLDQLRNKEVVVIYRRYN